MKFSYNSHASAAINKDLKFSIKLSIFLRICDVKTSHQK